MESPAQLSPSGRPATASPAGRPANWRLPPVRCVWCRPMSDLVAVAKSEPSPASWCSTTTRWPGLLLAIPCNRWTTPEPGPLVTIGVHNIADLHVVHRAGHERLQALSTMRATRGYVKAEVTSARAGAKTPLNHAFLGHAKHPWVLLADQFGVSWVIGTKLKDIWTRIAVQETHVPESGMERMLLPERYDPKARRACQLH